jgi:hypothetical protein
VWNQSVTRTRWLVAKLAVGCALAAAAAGLLSGAVTVWAQRLDSASHDRIMPLVFGARGIGQEIRVAALQVCRRKRNRIL